MFQKIGHQIQEMAKNSAKLSNKALIQKENFIGKKHKSFTYLVDEKTLTKKKKQPKCLRDQSHEKIDFTSQIGIEYFFRKVCQKGSLFREETANPPRCGFYHHFDPYLKVSIISSEVFRVFGIAAMPFLCRDLFFFFTLCPSLEARLSVLGPRVECL